MKKKILLSICLFNALALFAQNEKQEGDAMAAAENYSGAAMMYRICMEEDEQCGLKLFRLIYDKKIEAQSTDELYQLINAPAKKGNADAQFYFGKMYRNGQGVSKNEREAINWFRKSAEQGNADAQYELGQMYQSGSGVKTNAREAQKWYEKSAGQGHPEAQNNLKSMSKDQKSAKQQTPKNIVSAGVGFNGTEGYYYNNESTETTPLLYNLSYERILIDNILKGKGAVGVGGLVGYKTVQYTGWNGKQTNHDMTFCIKGVFHYALLEKLDTYAGLMGGYNYYIEKSAGTTYTYGEPAIAVFAGARYYVLPVAGVFAEVGLGYAFVNAGISFRF